MRDNDDGDAVLDHFVNTFLAFFLELEISNGENLVDDEDFRLDSGSDGEAQAGVHATRKVLHGDVDEVPEFGEVHDGVEF